MRLRKTKFVKFIFKNKKKKQFKRCYWHSFDLDRH